jgi:hexosaminidase
MKFNFTACLIFLCCISLQAQKSSYNLIPMPKEISGTKGIFSLNDSTHIISSPASWNEAQFFVSWLNQATGHNFVLEKQGNTPTSNFIFITANREFRQEDVKPLPKLPGDLGKIRPSQNEGAYKLIVDQRGVILSSLYNTGIFNGIQTFRQMFPVSAESGKMMLPYQFTCVRILDEPKFSHRGLLLDCCRHFMTVDFIKSYLDLLAYYKMNVLHWHLTEDQGWRIQIDKYPLLTEIGAWRTEEDGSLYGGFYTKDQIRDIVAYAAARHISIIPEIELPGHSCAAIAAYPELSCTKKQIQVENQWGVFKDIYCAGDENTYAFLENVLTEICELFPSPFIHIGGDEAPKFRWEQCLKCQTKIALMGLENEAQLQTYFIERIEKFLQSKGKRIIGWDEILEGGIPADAVVQSWRGMEGGFNAAKAGHEVIMSPTSHCYFDYGLDATDLKEVYSFQPIPDGLTNGEAQHILGGECNMWTEHAPQEKVDGKLLPRMLALSEVLWTYPEQRNYDYFYQRVMSHYDRLAALKHNSGFPAMPGKLKSSFTADGKMFITPVVEYDGVELKARAYYKNEVDAELVDYQPAYPISEPFELSERRAYDCYATFRNQKYDGRMYYAFWPHLGAGHPLTLSFEPSPYYLGGGKNALADGVTGGFNFRDGSWQAVQGKDMEATIDLGSEKPITHIRSNWFHYANAWIFRPSHIRYQISNDGEKWENLEEVVLEVPADKPGESIIIHQQFLQNKKARYVKMIAVNNGPCPEWHDAPGEPSWLFCDELIVE